ncbi:MAG: LysR family transcriptional regulator [Hyphomicrobiaceae bacterium]
MTINSALFDGMVVFCEVVESDGFASAARKLGHSPSHVSKEVARLEDRLGTRLLNRTTRTMSLTAVGQVYYEHARQIIQDARETEHRILGVKNTPFGSLRISAPVSFGLSHLADALPDFLENNADVTLDMEFNDRMVDVVAEGFDVVVRIGHLKDSSLIVRQIGTTRGLTVASPKYWKAHGKPRHPRDLEGHTCITYSLAANPSRWEYIGQRGEPISVDMKSRVKCNSAELETVLAVRSVGVTRLPEFVCARELLDGRLESVLEDFVGPSIGIYAVYPHRQHLSPKVRAFIDFLVDEFGENLEKADAG